MNTMLLRSLAAAGIGLLAATTTLAQPSSDSKPPNAQGSNTPGTSAPMSQPGGTMPAASSPMGQGDARGPTVAPLSQAGNNVPGTSVPTNEAGARKDARTKHQSTKNSKSMGDRPNSAGTPAKSTDPTTKAGGDATTYNSDSTEPASNARASKRP